jgi:uncharacterized protein (TIGR02145 family)
MKNKILFLIAVATLGLTAATMAQNLPIYVPANGLVGWWPFNGNANDESGNGNNGAINGAVLSIDRFGYSNQAFNFDGINDRIKIPFNLSFTNDTGSISLWMYSTQLPTVNDPQDCLFGKGWGYPQLVYRNNSKVYIQIANSSSSFPSVGTQSNISSNTWTHVLAIYEGPSLKIYINGTLNNSQILSPMPNYYSFCNSEFWIGGFRHQNSCMPNDSVQFFQGRIDDVGFWNRALTQQEITNLYNFQFPTQTSLCLPSVTTNTPTSIGIDSVVIGGDILNDGGSSIVLRGVCYSTTPNSNMGNPRTEEGSGIGSFLSTLRNLSPSTTYYARSYAKNSQGVVVYGNEVSFSTGPILGTRCPGTPSVTDIDGNLYHTVQIGTQCWTQGNLKVSKYRNGDAIPTYLIPNSWRNTNVGAYRYLFDDSTSITPTRFGRLYNHFAVMDSRGLCPTGWHVPSDSEWTVLANFLGGSTIAGGALKSTEVQGVSPAGWISPNTGATNSSGFSALPSHYLYFSGDWHGTAGSMCQWWTSTISGSWPWSRNLSFNSAVLDRWNNTNHPTYGNSIRCLKDPMYPTVSTTSINGITSNSAILIGNVTSDGGAGVLERGFVYDTIVNPTISSFSILSGAGIGTFADTLFGLNPETNYYVRAYATNSVGTSYGNLIFFTTTQLMVGDYFGGGYIVDFDSSSRTGLICAPMDTGWHVWGCMGTNIMGTSPSIGSGQINTNLILARCSARPIAASVCADLVLNGYEDWFLPSSQELLLAYTRLRPMNIGNLGPMNYSSSEINSDLVHDVSSGLGFIGLIGQAYKWQNSGVRPFRYFRLQSSFRCGTSTVSDVDGNNYNTVQIGNQCWTQSNLKVSKYRNGDNIPTGLNNSAWESTTVGAYAIYDNNFVNDGLYGKLYNHYAVMDNRGLCPTGWHVPTDGEWNVMVKYLDPNADTVCSNCWQSYIAGGVLKSTAIQPTPGGWNSTNAGATNSSGFTAGPGGLRFHGGAFQHVGLDGYWWSSSHSVSRAWSRDLRYDNVNIARYNNARYFGFSVRCLRD